MADVLVTNIERPKDSSSRELLLSLGNPNTPQGGWRWPREQVIASIEAGTNSFFVRGATSGKRYDIQVVRPETGIPYLTTVDSEKITEDLFELPEFS